MKALINVILALCVVGLAYICYGSIMGPINFTKEKESREKQIIARLIDIRKAEQEYRNTHDGKYTASFDTLIEFIKSAKLPFVMKEGVLSDEQLEKGLTEQKAAAMYRKAKVTGNYKELIDAGLQNFKRDTMWVAVLDTIFPKGFNPDSLRYIPFGNGAMFDTACKQDTTKSGAPVSLFECKAPYDTYLKGINEQELVNLKDIQTKLGKFCGLKIGDIETPNNNAGNWE